MEHGDAGAVWGKAIADRHKDHGACLQESMRADRDGDEVDIEFATDHVELFYGSGILE